MILMTQSIERSAVQTNAASGEPSYRFGHARYFYDKASYPKGTPADDKINVIRARGLDGVVIARVDTVAQALAAIESDSGRKVKLAGGTSGRREARAEGRIS